MGVAIVFLLLGLCLGFFLGARSKAVSAVRNFKKAVWSFVRKVQVDNSSPSKSAASAPAKPGQATASGGDDEKQEEDVDEPIAEDKLVESYLSSIDETNLDEHPDLRINPILMYQIKTAKEQQRIQQRIMALAAEGLDEDQIAAAMTSGAVDTGPATKIGRAHV